MRIMIIRMLTIRKITTVTITTATKTAKTTVKTTTITNTSRGWAVRRKGFFFINGINLVTYINLLSWKY